MCGVFGFCWGESGGLVAQELESCRDTLRHRGPDAAGSFQDRGLYLGFRRLAILDLSAEGQQPMTTRDGRYTIVFNGEIYNFLELRAELEGLDEVFRGRSDTEVLLRFWAREGTRCLTKLNGMFAFGVYDRLERTLTLVRDRLGVKPLFYWPHGRTLAFASELRALRRLPDFPKQLNPEALGLYFRLGTVPEWTSVFPGVCKLPPGSWVRYHLDTARMDGPKAYWDLPPVGEQEGKTEEQWLDDIEVSLWDATRIRLRSDVPLGIFLSGGIDSGLVAAAAAKQQKGLSSLTIGFPGEPQDETALALAAANHLGLTPIQRRLEANEGLGLLPGLMAHFDEPMADTSALPTSLVCAEARKQFTVALSGDAGDEVFAGYRNHLNARRWRWLECFPLGWRRVASRLLSSFLPPGNVRRKSIRKVGHRVGRFGPGAQVNVFDDILTACLKPEYNLDPNWVVESYDEHLPKWSGANSVDLAQRTDLRVYMLEDILAKVDRMSMLHSLEVRSPFLDFRLVELGLRIPARLRVKGGCSKYLLRRLAARHLPKPACQAPKRGFEIPHRSWLKNQPVAHVISTALLEGLDEPSSPFLNRGVERLSKLAQETPILPRVIRVLLCYHWWQTGLRRLG